MNKWSQSCSYLNDNKLEYSIAGNYIFSYFFTPAAGLVESPTPDFDSPRIQTNQVVFNNANGKAVSSR